ncbi:MAG: nucleotidyltransferase family protein [Anaerolineae bacterium]|nr:nucleotidyltransferase family protein [Anaerolineae bacterium]
MTEAGSTPEAAPTVERLVHLVSGEMPADEMNRLNHDEWEKIAVMAIVIGLAPILHWRLEQSLFNPPAITMAKLGVTRQAHAKRNEAIASQLAQILAGCASQDISAVVLKGAVLAQKAYPEAALRPMNDIDLLFRPEDLSGVGLLLERLGYQGKHKNQSHGPGITKHQSTYRRAGRVGATPNPYVSAGGDRTVEPHGSLEESWFGLKVDITPGVWERAVPVSLHGQPARRLWASDALLHLAVHATFHVIMGTTVFLQLYDIRQVIETWSNELDWSKLLGQAEQVGAEPFAYAALYWARRLFQAAIPDDILRTLASACPTHLVAHVRATGSWQLFRRTQQPPLVTLRQRLGRGISDRREAARWARSMGAKWQIWQTAVAIHKTDTAGLLTGRRLKAEV